MLVDVLAKSGEAAKSGPIGLAVILILCILCYFLFKSMSKHMRKVREEFPGQQPTDEATSNEATSNEATSNEATSDEATSDEPATEAAERPAE
jgi:hypothetical protein